MTKKIFAPNLDLGTDYERPLADPAATWTWDAGQPAYALEGELVDDAVRRASELVAACENAERALAGEILQAPRSLAYGESALGSEKPQALRAALTQAFTAWARQDATAASILALSLAPSPEYPLLMRTLEGERHTVKWLRHSLALGRESAVFELTNHFADQPDVEDIYRAADVRAHEEGEGPAHIAAIIALLPAQDDEAAVLGAAMKDLTARRARAEQIVAVEGASSANRITKLVGELETAARTAVTRTEAFSSWVEEPLAPAETDLGWLPPTFEIDRVRFARALAGILRGEYSAVEAAAGLAEKYDTPWVL